MYLDLSTLTKGQTRKLNALRQSLGNEIADAAFAKWMKMQTKEETFQVDPVAEKIKAALSSLEHDKAFRLGSKGYNSKGRRVKVRLGLQSVRLSRDWSSTLTLKIH